MADTPQTLAAITNALAQNYRDKVTRQINRRSVLLRLVKIEPGRGKNVAIDVEADGAHAENFSDGADVADYGSDALSPAVLPWALLRANFRVTDLALAAARSSMSPAGLVNLFARNLDSASSKLASRINAQLFSGSGSSNQIAGLGSVALRDDNTYAGINRLTGGNEYWRSNVTDLSAAALTFARLRTMIGDTIYTASGEQPTIAFCPPAVFNYIGGLFQEQRRYSDTARVVQTPRGPVTLDASIGTLEVDGCVFIKDKDAPTGEIQLVNPEYVVFEYLPQDTDPVLSDAVREQAAQDGYGPIPLGFRVTKLARTGASSKFSLQVFGQLRVDRPNACGRLINFTMPTS